MKRRELLGGLALGPYSLVVLADQIPPAEHVPASVEEIQRQLDRLTPATGPAGVSARERKMAEITLECDFLVAGGGLAGVCAALAAARHGAKVILVQDRSRLGGNSSSEVKMHVCGSHAIAGWRETGIVEELRIEDAVRNPQRAFEMWDLLLYDKVISERNITLLMDSTLYAAKKKGDRIDEVFVRSDRAETAYRIRAKYFCDATGDCRLGFEAGAEMRTGREPREEFGESLAMDKGDDETLGSSILFTSRLYRRPMPFVAPAWARKINKEHLRTRTIREWDYGYWWIAWGGNKDIIHDNERIRFELLSIVLGVWDYIKNSGEHPESSHWAMDWIGMLPGKRGSRRMVGDHILTQHDLVRGDIEDAVAIGGWPMDDHPPGGFDRSDLKPNVAVRLQEAYNIPFRSLYSRNIANLFMAGRNISCSHVAFTSTRVMATCGAAGQAVGTAAALCLERGVSPRELYRKHVAKLQQALLRDDQTIKNRLNEDPLDAAREAKVTASAEEPGAEASKVVDGCLRDIPKKKDAVVHRWTGRMTKEGAWIELRWDAPRRIGQVQLTFDTGLQRRLMLSASASVTVGQIRAPQPETVKDYRVLAQQNGKWVEVASVKGNYERLRRHRFAAMEADAVRVQVDATNGDDFARVFEVRCYA
ncbi:MAG: FAD-dependent oxidoreductase [Bryobacterales bacterium]|nr:FAD-dependent oxidoreductase [Bryobacterales bacterium]